ncbi:MAG: VCBS repeat-containing protein [Polyangiaceae bacterium]|nr:VCBS repeat-containing protein [Polyangiaceae bacterium]
MVRTRALAVMVVAMAWAALLPAACGSDDGKVASNAGSGGGAGDASTDGAGATGGAILDGTTGCTNGQPCGDGGICAGGVCCSAALACGAQCCGSGDVCSFSKCVQPGAVCVDSSDCASGQYCEYALGDGPDGGAPGDAGAGDGGACVGGKVQLTGRCLPEPPICAPSDPNPGSSCLEKCEVVPPTTAFDPVVKYSWGGETTPPYSTDVMMTPIVIQLDDDNCDGKITGDDIPEIGFVTFTGGGYYRPGTLRVVSVQNGALVEKWNKPDAVHASSGLAAGDIDGDGVPEIVACLAPAPGGVSCCDEQAYNTGVVAFKANGDVLWTQTDTTQVHCGYESPAIADPDGTGPLVLVGLTLLDGKTGAIVKNLDPAHSWGTKLTGFADVDGDGKLDVVQGQRAFRTSGNVIWDLSQGTNTISGGYHAVGDLDNDGKPEVVIISSGGPHTAHVVQFDAGSPSGAKIVRQGIDINNGISTATFCNAASEYGGGPPIIADFDGDGFPDVGAAGAVGYIVLSGKKLMDPTVANADTTLWFKTTQDCSSAVTGSSVFDFNGDGKAEVVYADEVHLWMYDGATGTNLIPETCNTSGTLWEYPVVADVDNDGQADIVLASNAYGLTCNGTKQAGIRVFSSASGSWVRTRRVWNQHTYHVTNVEESGAIPKSEVANWTVPGLNNFRQNKQPGGEFAAPDAVVRVSPKCGGSYGLVATVRNLGQAVLPPGVGVTFYSGAPPSGTPLGQAATTIPLGPAQAQDLLLDLPNAPAEVRNGQTTVYAEVTVPAPTVECRTDNNTSPPESAACTGPR